MQATGDKAKDIKRQINTQLIYPPLGTRCDSGGCRTVGDGRRNVPPAHTRKRGDVSRVKGIDVLSKSVAVGILVIALSASCWAQQQRAPARSRRFSAGRGTLNDPNAPKGVYATSHGVVKSISKSVLMVAMDDEHEMKFRITRKTKFFSGEKQGSQEIRASAIESGQAVAVDAETALDGSFEAVRIVLESRNAK